MSRRVVIIGGGFSGAATAAALLRRREPGLHVTLVERSGVFGRGVAYGTPRPEHLLNVAAGKMSALPDELGHFLAWARDAGHAAGEHDFVPRALYGDYAQAVLAEAERAAPAGAIERITGEVTAIAPRPAGRRRSWPARPPGRRALRRARERGRPPPGGRRGRARAGRQPPGAAAVRRSRRGPPVLRRRPVGR